MIGTIHFEYRTNFEYDYTDISEVRQWAIRPANP